MPQVPKLSLAMYPFSVWIDEHVPLNIGAGSIFFQVGTNNGFSRVGPKTFSRAKQTWQNYILTTRNLENNFFAKKIDGKTDRICLLKEILSQHRIDTKILQSIYFAYKVGIISSYSNRI